MWVSILLFSMQGDLGLSWSPLPAYASLIASMDTLALVTHRF